MTSIYVNDGFGVNENSMGFASLPSYEWISKIFEKDEIKLGAKAYDATSSSTQSYDGTMSCFQIFDVSMNHASVLNKKYCPDLTDKKKPCIDGYHYFNGACFGITMARASYSFAEAMCLPDPNSRFESRLAITDNLEHLDFISQIAKMESGHQSAWIGLSDREENGIYLSR